MATLKAKKTRSHSRNKTLPPRWQLTDLLQDPDRQFKSLSKTLDKHIRTLEASRPRLKSTISPTLFKDLLHLTEKIRSIVSTLMAYGQLWFAQDTKNLAARTFETQVKEYVTHCNNRIMFFDIWWQQLEQPHAQRLLKHAGDCRYYLESLRRFAPYTLSENEERIINIKNSTGRAAFDTLYELATSNYSFRLRVGRSTKTLTREGLTAYFRHPSRSVRQEAYKSLLRVYSQQRDILGEIYTTLVLDWKNEGLSLRGHSSPIAVRNLGNDIPDQAVQALLQTCRKHAPVFQKYFRIKAKICGISRLSRYDVYAPGTTVQTRIPYEKAVNTVLKAYRNFSPTLADHAQTVLDRGHIDAQPSPGKMGGAFCYSVLPTLTPFVLMSYTGTTRDVATLAHELGHAVHSLLASHHSVFTFHSTLPLAETASVFGEQLLADQLMQQISNRRARQSLLLAQLDDLYATILRQAYFVLFEQQAHDMIAHGATLDQLAEHYLHLLHEQFGPQCAVPSEFQWEWLSIPHIFRSPFYCYAYSFGNLIVLALYQRYQTEGPSFVPKYLELLAAGGSQSPESLLSPLGIDISSTRFWEAGFMRIAQLVGSLEQTMT